MYQVLAVLVLPVAVVVAVVLAYRVAEQRRRLALIERLAEARRIELRDFKQRAAGMRNQINELNRRIAGLVAAKSEARQVVERLSSELDRSFAIGGHQVARGFQETQPLVSDL